MKGLDTARLIQLLTLGAAVQDLLGKAGKVLPLVGAGRRRTDPPRKADAGGDD